MPYSHLTLAFQGATAIVTLDRPAQRNALSLALMREVIECLDELERNGEARAIILAAAGPAFFSSSASRSRRSWISWRRRNEVASLSSAVIAASRRRIVSAVR